MTTVHAVDDLEITAVWEEDLAGPTELRITSPTGVTTRGLRAITLSAWVQPFTPLPEGVIGDMTAVGDWLHRYAPGRGNGHTLTDLFLAKVALFYTLSIRAGDRDPVACMANYSRVKVTTANRWTRIARDKGLLTGTTRGGRANGKLTEKALELIR